MRKISLFFSLFLVATFALGREDINFSVGRIIPGESLKIEWNIQMEECANIERIMFAFAVDGRPSLSEFEYPGLTSRKIYLEVPGPKWIGRYDYSGDMTAFYFRPYMGQKVIFYFQVRYKVSSIWVDTQWKSQTVTVLAPNEITQNYPNPFNPETQISYTIAKAGRVKLSVYNVLGQKVADLVDEHKTANTYKVTFDASKLPSGIYFYKLKTNDFVKTKKMILQR